MECLGATPLERLCGYIINLFPSQFLYSTELRCPVERIQMQCRHPLICLFQPLSSPLSLSLNLFLRRLSEGRSWSWKRERGDDQINIALRKWASTVWLFGCLLLPLPVFCIASLSDRIIGAWWPISQVSQIRSHAEHVRVSVWQAWHAVLMQWVGGKDSKRDKESGEKEEEWTVSQCHEEVVSKLGSDGCLTKPHSILKGSEWYLCMLLSPKLLKASWMRVYRINTFLIFNQDIQSNKPKKHNQPLYRIRG